MCLCVVLSCWVCCVSSLCRLVLVLLGWFSWINEVVRLNCNWFSRFGCSFGSLCVRLMVLWLNIFVLWLCLFMFSVMFWVW